MADDPNTGFELFDEDEPLPPKSTSAPQENKHGQEDDIALLSAYKRLREEQQHTGRDTKTGSVPETEKEADEEQKKQKQEQPKDLVKAMEENVRTAILERSAEPPTICEVPEELAEGNKGAYAPRVVCIGLLSDSKRGSPGMLRLECYKWCCVRKLIVVAGSSWSEEHALLLRKCFGKMLSLAPQIRASYSSVSSSIKDNYSNNSDDAELARNMLLDGCFILHRLLKYARKARKSFANIIGDDGDEWAVAFGRCWVWGTVKRDLLLLSNQVPFFVLRKLFKLLVITRNNDGGVCDDVLVQGALHLFSSLHPRPMTPHHPIACHDVHHLLHLFYLSIDLPPQPHDDDDEDHNLQKQQQPLLLPRSEHTRWVPCAKELDEAGVTITPRTRGARSFLDVAFRGGTIEIPPLRLFDYSEPLFRNLLAFEQTYPDTPGRFTAYAVFMDCLLKTPEDARLLHRNGVLVNHMNGDREDTAMGFFSRLCAEAHSSSDRNYLAGVMEEVVKYQAGRWPRWRAALVTNYFTNPWVTTSVVVAGFLLALTALQSFYSVYGYYKPLK